MYSVKDDSYIILDNLYPFEDGTSVASRWLRNPRFSIDQWYWRSGARWRTYPTKKFIGWNGDGRI